MTTPTESGRRYGGLTADERKALRRAQLVEAGLELFGTVGFAGTSIRAVLRQSGLAERYFYESFDSLEALLVAVHEEIHLVIVSAVRSATDAAGDDIELRTRAGLRAFIDALTTDERYVRLKLQELHGSAGEEMRQFRAKAVATYAGFLIAFGPLEAARAKGLHPQILAGAVVAAIEAMLDAWTTGEFPVDVDGLIDHAVVVVVGTANHLRTPQFVPSPASSAPEESP